MNFEEFTNTYFIQVGRGVRNIVDDKPIKTNYYNLKNKHLHFNYIWNEDNRKVQEVCYVNKTNKNWKYNDISDYIYKFETEYIKNIYEKFKKGTEITCTEYCTCTLGKAIIYQ